MSSRSVAVLGATGSIGRATIDVLERLGSEWRVAAISGHRRLDTLAELARRTSARQVVLSDASAGGDWSECEWPAGVEFSRGPEALVQAATAAEVDTVVAAIVGRAGVESTLAALQAGKRVALANKETLVCAGPVVAELLGKSPTERLAGPAERLAGPASGGRLLPVDSEHSAIFQCLAAGPDNPRRLILTASGGPFRQWSLEQMQAATVAEALEHPTWRMGKKITIDSATMMNKALELIEARWLFGCPAESLEVVVHPQSIIHSMVEFADGSVVAQLSPPDMRLPIQYALTYPQRLPCPSPPLERGKPWELTLEPVDQERFPAIPLGFEVAAKGGTAGAVVNAANEAAVDLFLSGQIRFTDIVPACRAALEHHTFEERPSLSRLLELDRWARAEVGRWSCRA
ncbi:1-deoxy-D-xylulose-5-phosphate reductoisomerase [Candidatus Laterigemmans baculatus]|uniref:1-deoxy-D-xylulose-5-phosphate reductoisomerase n=1 Tax=Candidatus Laterigemmans baculatus TaxID=2770505 RepID=UPI0013DD5C37|nr:1-deoxy-D-xylulose-5-phosphate reductoisomerase [Candidatus Laterigemmans baculatus]